ncbi:MAG TPA: redoxin family protein [Candidatus Acidoferrum sp.]|nr:redoxin family protein [Candidatus Acidoferrum sp.]
MHRAILSFLLLLFARVCLPAQDASNPVSQAISQGDLYFSKHQYELAFDAYNKADKLSHHTSAVCYLKRASLERKLGGFSFALDDAKRAEKAAGDDKSVAVRAHELRAALLAQMAGKPTDKKLKEAEEELRQALALDSTQPLAHYDLGMVLLKQEQDAEGVAELKTFVSLPGADPKTVAEARRTIANPIRGREPFAPDFSFTTPDNQDVSNASLRGKVVLLDFWATWCPPCRESLPAIRNVDKKYTGKQFQLISISGDDDEELWRTFTAAQHMTWSEYIDLSGDVQEAFKVDSFPTYVVLDKDGVVRFRQSGFGESTESDIEDAINKALKRPSDPSLAAAAGESAPAETPVPPLHASSSAAPPAGNANRKDEEADDVASPLSSGIDAGTISGNTYKNDDLQIAYDFPQGWIPASLESLHSLNARKEAAMRVSILQQHPELASSIHLGVPQVLLYVSRTGRGDAERPSVPSLRISAARTRLDDVNLDTFDQLVKNIAVAQSLKIVMPASQFTVKGHNFVRADFAGSGGSSSYYLSYIQSVSGDYMLTITMLSSSQAELDKMVASLQSMVISDE